MQKRSDVYVPGMKYQVLWLLHGGSGDDSDYVNFSNIVRYADDHKLAVVMPADYNAMYSDDPEGAKYFTFVVEELPQMCRALFPFSDKREDNFVAGLSMGGAGTFKCAMLHPELYSAAICMSGAGSDPAEALKNPRFSGMNIRRRIPEPGSAEDAWAAAKRNKEAGVELPKMYLTAGDKDFVLEGVRKCRDYLTELGYDLTYEEVPGYGHEWDFWDLTLRKAIKEWLPIRHSVIYPEK
jgi:S-formylglutathione hydrolase FrmB